MLFGSALGIHCNTYLDTLDFNLHISLFRSTPGIGNTYRKKSLVKEKQNWKKFLNETVEGTERIK
jgi:hypothetical protein